MSIESSIIGFLADRLTETVTVNGQSTTVPVSVSAETPPGPPGKYVVVERTGGGEEQSGLLRATFAIRSCAPTIGGAMGLSGRVRTAMRLLPTLHCVFSCRCTREYNFSNPADKHRRRYQAVFDVLYLED